MFEIGNKEILIDECDVDLLVQYRWKIREDRMIVEDLEAYDVKPERSPKLLRTLIAFRMGMTADHYVLFKSDNWMDYRRSNLALHEWTAEKLGFTKK